MIALLCSTCLIAQTRTVSGVVHDETGESVIGASVLITGTTNGTITDINGNFNITGELSAGATLTISYVGYKTYILMITSKDVYTVTLKEDSEALEEVVVIGYGVQKKSVVTAAISSINADDLETAIPTRLDNLLKGKASGVTITTASGQPGAGSQVRIRGIGTINNSDPLYIVDGMAVGGIDYLNPTDIASIEVLKDAASAAIYGTRAANGVILVTTKSGAKNQKATISYDMSYGWQNPWKKKGVLNAPWYQTIQNESLINDGKAPKYAQITTEAGTDWQDAIFNYNAPVQSHQVSLSGGGEKVDYFLSFGYFGQEGIVGGNYDRSNYERYSVRSNNNYTAFDEKRFWIPKLTIGVNANFTYSKSTGIAENSQFYSPLGSALLIDPMQPIYAEDPEAVLLAHPTAIVDEEGRVYSIPDPTMSEIINPVAGLHLPASWNYVDRLTANAFADLTILPGLNFRSSFNVDYSWNSSDGWSYPFYLSSGGAGSSNNSSVSSTLSRTYTWQVENTLSYTHSFEGDHNLNVLVGQSAQKTSYKYVSGIDYGLPTYDAYKATIDYCEGDQKDERVSGGRSYSTLASYFARASYDYASRYMIQVTVRVDGSDKFGENNKWGVFPSVSAGWNIINEPFMENVQHLSNLKLRASWGKNGNQQIDAFAYMALIAAGSNYTFGKGDTETITTGTRLNRLANPNLRWEESNQTDVGLELGFMNNALTFGMDYFYKRTDGMLMVSLLPAYVGVDAPWDNVGKMENQGVEFEANYKFKAGPVDFAVSGNISWIKNKLIDYGNESGSQNLDNLTGIGTVSRAENGEVYPFFYGYKTDGIFQTQDEVNAYVNDRGELLQPDAQQGDVRFVDFDENGIINDDDRTKIGKGLPDITYGFSLSIEWNGLDFSAFFQGVGGNEIFDATRRLDLNNANMPSWIVNRWTGPNSTNTLPRVTQIDPNDNWRSSDLYIKNGSYLRLKTLQIGYSFPQKWMRKIHFQKIRLYFAAENLLTFTGYDGFDPEIGSGGTSLGIDMGCYPQARTLSVGLNIAL